MRRKTLQFVLTSPYYLPKFMCDVNVTIKQGVSDFEVGRCYGGVGSDTVHDFGP